MILRIWMLLLAVVLLAAPANTTFAEVDAQAEHVPDEVVTQIVVAIQARTPAQAVVLTGRDTRPPPSPAQTQVFRPPRHAFV